MKKHLFLSQFMTARAKVCKACHHQYCLLFGNIVLLFVLKSFLQTPQFSLCFGASGFFLCQSIDQRLYTCCFVQVCALGSLLAAVLVLVLPGHLAQLLLLPGHCVS